MNKLETNTQYPPLSPLVEVLLVDTEDWRIQHIIQLLLEIFKILDKIAEGQSVQEVVANFYTKLSTEDTLLIQDEVIPLVGDPIEPFEPIGEFDNYLVIEEDLFKAPLLELFKTDENIFLQINLAIDTFYKQLEDMKAELTPAVFGIIRSFQDIILNFIGDYKLLK